MNTTQTRKPFLTPAARSRPQLFCRNAATGELLWSRDDGLPIHTNRDLKINFPESCGFLKQSDGLVSVGVIPSTVFVHEYQGKVLMMTASGDLLTCDENGLSLAVHRGVLGPFSGAIAAANRTVWVNVDNNLVAVDIINGIQSVTSMSDFSPFQSSILFVSAPLVHPDGAIVVIDNNGWLAAIRPDGSIKWGPFNYPSSGVGFFWGSFLDGDMVTSVGVISASSGEVIATWPEGRGTLGSGELNASDLADIVIWQNEKVLTHLWVKEWAEGFGPDDGFWMNFLYFSELDRNLNIVREEKMPTDNWPDYSGIPDPWFLYDLEFVSGIANFYPNSESLVGSWLSDLSLPTPVPIPIALFPHANKKRSNRNELDYPGDPPNVLRHSGGFFCSLEGNILASFDSSGQLRWQVAIPNGPQQGTTNYALSDDETKIYYVD